MKKSLAVLLILLLTSCSGIFSVETIYDCSGELTMLAENGGKNKEATKMALRLRKFRSIVDLWNKSDAWLKISFINAIPMDSIYTKTEIRGDYLYIFDFLGYEGTFDDSDSKHGARIGMFNLLSNEINLSPREKFSLYKNYSGHCIERK